MNGPLHAFAICMLPLFLLLMPVNASAQFIALPTNSVWKFEDTGTDLGTAWRDPGYVDSVWSFGPGILGYGEGFIDTPVSNGGNPNNVNRTPSNPGYPTGQ